MTSALNVHTAKNNAIRVFDQNYEQIPDDLYIPPAAFQILLNHFEGPFDFLLYLIKKNGFDLLQLDISPIATQYLNYINRMESFNIELSADYLVMAALLADLKSKLLLPKPRQLILEDDPKKQLVERLEHYVQIKSAAERLNALNILDRDTFQAQILPIQAKVDMTGFQAHLLTDALQCLFNRPEPVTHHIQEESVSLEERIQYIESCVRNGNTCVFEQLLRPQQGRMGMVVTFMAILELARQAKVQIVETGIEAPLSICGATSCK